MMLRLILLFIVIVTSSLVNSSVCQVVWETHFEIPNKGIWVDSSGNSIVDTSKVDWLIDFDQCTFSDVNDYAKTVSTSRGRFEVLDSDETVYWKSPNVDISTLEMVSIQLKAAETGSRSNSEKKFIMPQIIVDGKLNPFSSDSIASGNWGEKIFQQTGIKGDNLQIVVKMNSSYSADKVYIDDVIIEAINPRMLEATSIVIIETENVSIFSDTIIVSANLRNAYQQKLNNENLQLNLESEQLQVINYSFENGNYRWQLLPIKIGKTNYTIKPIELDVAPISGCIQIINETDLIIANHYEDTTIALNSDWEISTQNPIEGMSSVKHKQKDLEGISTIELFNDSLNLQQDHFHFRFKIKNGEWNPSSSNHFHYCFLQGKNGYAFGVNATGSSDLFSIWKIENNEPSELLLETDYLWQSNTSIEIEIYKTAQGKWELFLRNEENKIVGTGSITNHLLSVLNQLQLNFEFTKTRSGLLWFDDLKIAKVDIPPTITKVKSVDIGKLLVSFNEPIDTVNFKKSLIKISNEKAICKINNFSFDSDKTLVINFEPENSLNFKLQITSVKDLQGNLSEELNLNFVHAIAPKPHDLIFTEIMADPTPSAGLPEIEYLEIFNVSNAYLLLEETTIRINGKSQIIPEKVLAPKSYWLLCETKDTSFFPSSTPIISLQSLPTLLNSGTSLALSSHNEIIDSIYYDPSWYANTEKAKGGFSLEKIDPNRFCGNQSNWSASEAPLGGTPGFGNSIHAFNIDLLAPQIEQVNLVSSKSIAIYFSETIDTLSTPFITFEPTINIEKIEYQKDNKSMKVEFIENCTEDLQYEIFIENITDECGNVAPILSDDFIWHHIEKGDIFISELLFNPIGDGTDFFELYNVTNYSIDLSKLKVATRDDSLTLKSISPLSINRNHFRPTSFSVFTNDTLNFIETYNLPKDASYYQLNKMPAFNNDHGIIVLLNDSLEIIDEFEYDENMHSLFIYNNEGISLERISFNRPTNKAENWYSGSTISDYVSPCFGNTKTNQYVQSISVEIESEVVSPNLDNYNDELVLHFHLDQTEYLTNLFVFDINGNFKAHPLNNELVSNNATIVYDCKTKDGQILNSAPYFILIEMISAKGRKQQLREVFYVSNSN